MTQPPLDIPSTYVEEYYEIEEARIGWLVYRVVGWSRDLAGRWVFSGWRPTEAAARRWIARLDRPPRKRRVIRIDRRTS